MLRLTEEHRVGRQDLRPHPLIGRRGAARGRPLGNRTGARWPAQFLGMAHDVVRVQAVEKGADDRRRVVRSRQVREAIVAEGMGVAGRAVLLIADRGHVGGLLGRGEVGRGGRRPPRGLLAEAPRG